MWGWRWMERGVLVMGDGKSVGVVRGEPDSSGGGVLGAAEAVPHGLSSVPALPKVEPASTRASEIA